MLLNPAFRVAKSTCIKRFLRLFYRNPHRRGRRWKLSALIVEERQIRAILTYYWGETPPASQAHGPPLEWREPPYNPPASQAHLAFLRNQILFSSHSSINSSKIKLLLKSWVVERPRAWPLRSCPGTCPAAWIFFMLRRVSTPLLCFISLAVRPLTQYSAPEPWSWATL